MKSKLAITSIFFVANCYASGFYSQQNECHINVNKNTNIDFFTASNQAFNGGTEGAFTITAGDETVRVFVIPIFKDDNLSHGGNYRWMIDGYPLTQFDESYSLGDVEGGSSHEFKVYPQSLMELLPAGEITSEINLEVQCIPHSRLSEKYKRIVGFEMIRG